MEFVWGSTYRHIVWPDPLLSISLLINQFINQIEATANYG